MTLFEMHLSVTKTAPPEPVDAEELMDGTVVQYPLVPVNKTLILELTARAADVADLHKVATGFADTVGEWES